jgi:predicted RND superfamily exporter protein
MPFEISIDTKRKRGATQLANLEKINELEDALFKYPELSKPVSIVDAIKFMRQAYYNGKEIHYKLPTNQEQNFIMSYIPEDQDKQQFINTFVDSTNQITRISLRIADIGTYNVKRVVEQVKNEIQQIFPEDKYEVIITGSSIVYTQGTSYLIKNLFTSLALAIVLISIFMAFMFSSVRMVLVSLIPNLIPLLMTAAIMGYFGISIKPSTILVFSIAFGISVDNAIHFLAKYRQELHSTNWNISKSVISALKETGVSIIYNAIILFFGFGIFIASKFGGTEALGMLVSITLLLAMLANLLLLPSLLLSLEHSITTQAFKEPLLQTFDEEEDIELSELKIHNNNH